MTNQCDNCGNTKKTFPVKHCLYCYAANQLPKINASMTNQQPTKMQRLIADNIELNRQNKLLLKKLNKREKLLDDKLNDNKTRSIILVQYASCMNLLHQYAAAYEDFKPLHEWHLPMPPGMSKFYD